MEKTSVTAQRRLVIKLFNVKYSPNLGDGLLSEALEHTLIAQGAHAKTTSIDLAGRTEYGPAPLGRGQLLAALDKLPSKIRQMVVRMPLAVQRRRVWAPHYAKNIKQVDAVAIGGGNLLSDMDLNFPTKIAAALTAASAHDLPVAFYACGMGGNWSREGSRRMRRALERWPPQAVFLRDTASKDRWDSLLAPAAGREATVVRDPGLLAAEVWPRQSGSMNTSDGAPIIGIGIMSSVAIRYHAEAGTNAQSLGRWYLELAKLLDRAGAKLRIFTNGAPEDIAAAEAIRQELAGIGPGLQIARPHSPAELAGIVSGCDAVVAFRMHAVIAAYSYGVPALALSWDDKLTSFMQSVKRDDWLRDIAATPPALAAELLLQAAQEVI
ncbi:MAG: polysaccharide pyruvyl transferase family protein, partial [Pseudomonadota bacterium]